MIRHALVACLVVATLHLDVGLARAEDEVAIVVQGCDPAWSERIARALELELSAPWRIVEPDGQVLVVLIAAEPCDGPVWTARILDVTGATLVGPVALTVAGFEPASRARITALWITDALAELRAAADKPPILVVAEPDAAPPAEPSVAEPAVIVTPPDAPRELQLGVAGALAVRSDYVRMDDEDVMRLEWVGGATFHWFPATTGWLAGVDVGARFVLGGEVSYGAELRVGLDAGHHWLGDAGTFRASLGGFASYGPAPWITLEGGARLTFQNLLWFASWSDAQSAGSAQGLLGLVLRASTPVARDVATYFEVELGGAFAALQMRYANLPGAPTTVDLFQGFFLALRVGVVLE